MTPSWFEDLPRCLSGVVTTRISVPQAPEEPPVAAFQIRCRSCGAGAFRLSEVSHGESATGIIVQCLECVTEYEVFDGMIHGYEGEQGYTNHLKGPRSVQPLVWFDGTRPQVSKLVAVLTYSDDPDELEEIAREANLRPSDLFEWFELVANLSDEVSSESDRETIWEYECA
jgi:hypothetical protein